MSPSVARRLADVLGSRLARAGILLSASTVAAGLLAYAFQVVMGRMLDTSEYGVFAAMMALFAVLSAPLGSLLMVVSRKVSELRARGESGALARFWRDANVRALAAGLPLLVLFVLFAPTIQRYLRAPSLLPVNILGALLLVSLLPILNNAFLQGLQRFAWLSGTGIVSAILKIAAAALLVGAGFGLAGAMGALVLTAVATWLMTYVGIAPALSHAAGAAEPTRISLRSAVPVFAANAAFAAMTQFDMVAVNYFFPPHEAGLYAAASVLGKAILYLPGGIVLALFPMVAENDARNEGSAHLLLQAVALTLAMCVSASVVCFLFAEPLIALLYGEPYRAAGSILRYYGFAIMPMALILVAEHFLIAKGRVLFAYLFVFIAPLQLAAIYLWHPSLLAILAVIGVAGLVLVMLGYGLLWRALRQSTARA